MSERLTFEVERGAVRIVITVPHRRKPGPAGAEWLLITHLRRDLEEAVAVARDALTEEPSV